MTHAPLGRGLLGPATLEILIVALDLLLVLWVLHLGNDRSWLEHLLALIVLVYDVGSNQVSKVRETTGGIINLTGVLSHRCDLLEVVSDPLVIPVRVDSKLPSKILGFGVTKLIDSKNI